MPRKDRDRAGSAIEVLLAFAKLGVSCFGGPVAHIGYFRQEFVVRRRWLDEQAYADLVALCQFLPGPASSQVGFSLGLMRAGYLGGLAAWAAFTLPSAIALLLFAYGATALKGEIGSGLLHGLKLVAVAIVAQAVWGMARTLCPDRERASIALVAALIILLSSSSIAQIGAIVFGAIAGLSYNGAAKAVWCASYAGTNPDGTPLVGLAAPTGHPATPIAGTGFNCDPGFTMSQIGLTTRWTPVKNLTFSSEVMYSYLKTNMSGLAAGTTSSSFPVPGGPTAVWQYGNVGTVNVNLRVQRNF